MNVLDSDRASETATRYPLISCVVASGSVSRNPIFVNAPDELEAVIQLMEGIVIQFQAVLGRPTTTPIICGF